MNNDTSNDDGHNDISFSKNDATKDVGKKDTTGRQLFANEKENKKHEASIAAEKDKNGLAKSVTRNIQNKATVNVTATDNKNEVTTTNSFDDHYNATTTSTGALHRNISSLSTAQGRGVDLITDKKPVSSFDLTEEEDIQYDCSYYCNTNCYSDHHIRPSIASEGKFSKCLFSHCFCLWLFFGVM